MGEVIGSIKMFKVHKRVMYGKNQISARFHYTMKFTKGWYPIVDVVKG